MDIKTAFLQSKQLDQPIYLLSKEANVPPGYIWKLSKCVYGLTDARSVMVIVVGNGHGDKSSNPGQDWLHFT